VAREDAGSIDDQIFASRFRWNQIHELPERARLVRLVYGFRPPPPDDDVPSEGVWWLVEDILTGVAIKCPATSLGRQLNDMEVLAWAARL
jgi:hypothetical protein